MKSNFEKMRNGEIYYTAGEEIQDPIFKNIQICNEYNKTLPSEKEKRKKIIKELFKKTGENFTIIPIIRVDFGCNITIGENFYSNYNLSILDEGYVTIGDNCYIGPNCSFLTACHPIDFSDRNAYYEWTKAINIGNNVCIEGNVTVLPGVNIGNNVIVRAGSVVTKNVKDNCIVGGNPCVIEREIKDKKII
jgi:acetyltransferase-like isoleucine patch superfamily enzyme